MASAAAMSAARSMPAVYSVPLGPRVRPPRLLPGTKADNTNPQPDGLVPHAKVWVQGKWREHNSNASKATRKIQSIQVEKALRQSTHGMNIYAYRQIRTNQVVYSLSRVMQNNKVLSQLIYHGKQTRPAALRRDVWRPYFSIHFPQTQAGAEAGLGTYQVLRELSARRQLSPPEGSLLATKEDVEKAQATYDPATLARLKEEKSTDLSKLPRLGRLLPPKYRAKKLMDQKASSVADAAFALSLINNAALSPHDKKVIAEARLKSKHSERTRRNRRRINEIRRQEEAKETQIGERQLLVDAEPGQLTLDKYAAARIALEHNGVLITKDRVTGLDGVLKAKGPTDAVDSSLSLNGLSKKPDPFDADKFKNEFTQQWEEQHRASETKPPFPTQELDSLVEERLSDHRTKFEAWQQDAQQLDNTTKADGQASRQVLVLWSDLKDAMNAEKWTPNVQHDWFDAKAVVKQQRSVVRQPAFIDEDGHEIEEQRQKRLFQLSSSPHVMGRDVSDNWLSDTVQHADVQDTSSQESNFARREYVVRMMIAARSELRDIQALYVLQNSPEPEKMPTSMAMHEEFANSTGEPADIQESEEIITGKALDSSEQKVEFLRSRYPEYADALDKLEHFTDLIARHRKLAKEVKALEPGVEGRQQLMDQEHALAKEIRDHCDTQFPGFSAFEKQHQESLLQSPSEPRMKELEDESDTMKVKIILKYHRKLLERQGDDNFKYAAREDDEPEGTASTTEHTGRKMNEQDLKDMNVEVDMQELDKRSMWTRVKGVFGR